MIKNKKPERACFLKNDGNYTRYVFKWNNNEKDQTFEDMVFRRDIIFNEMFFILDLIHNGP